MATTGKTFKDIDHVVGLLGSNGDEGLVVVCEEPRAKTPRFSPKKVTRYIVRSGLICGYQEPSEEAFPDIEFEKAVYASAMRAKSESGFAVTLLKGWVQPVTLKAEALGCVVEVTAINGYTPYGEILCTKIVNLCRPDRE